ncbi:MAG: hypothetical protein PHI79_06780 [Sulfurovaceae bacterium]|nr:hypothetical protein [Sulfurovaceae bacterium]MDD5549280.1 hypothetical protein [Sulfurovaceae bacterium]
MITKVNRKVIDAYKTTHNIIKKAINKEILEIEQSINDPKNASVKEHLQSRKKELSNALDTIIKFIEE